MKIKDLIVLLQKEDPERKIILSSDAEGNRFRALASVETVAWDPDNREIGIEPADLTYEARKLGFTEEDVMEDGVPAIVFYPV